MPTLTFAVRCLLGVALCLLPAAAHAELAEGDFKQWALLAIQDNGRRKPVDTFARESLLRLSGRASYKSLDGHVWAPNEFLLSALLGEGREWKKEPLVLINYRPLVKELGLDPERKRYSFEELTKLKSFETASAEIRALRLGNREAKLDRRQQEIESVGSRLSLLVRLMNGESLLIAPPAPGGETGDGVVKSLWLAPPDAAAAYGEARFTPIVQDLQAMAQAYHAANPFDFSLKARELREGLRRLNPAVYPPEAALGREFFYNHLSAFAWAVTLYFAGFIALAISGLLAHAPAIARALRFTGIGAGLGGLILHGGGLGLRCAIAGRPPVTNMFESMVWVSFVVTLFGFAFFARYRGIMYLLAALPVSCLTLLAVMQAPVAMPASIDPLVPVLRDNFWLTIHVLTITASYGAFALAMGFGHILLFRHLANPVEAQAESVLHFWLYRIMQLGVLLVAAGTILGGVWANYSWGRFWGWDPKETWAFITLLCYIVALHGRIAGWWGKFGLAVASVLCFAAVLMAWYGVNLLGKGLHSYGHTFGGEVYVLGFAIVDVAFVGAVCWRHRQAQGGAGGPLAA